MKLTNESSEGYILDPSPLSIEEIKESSAFKIKMRRYVAKELLDGRFTLKKQSTAETSTLMINRLTTAIHHLGYSLDIDESIFNEIQAKKEYTEERSRAGIEIKNHDSKYFSQYKEYSEIVNEAFERPLRERQMWDSFFMCAMGKAGNFSVPGSGKTAAVLGVFAYLKNKGLVNRIIVICPKNAFSSWQTEFNACFGSKENLSAFSIQETSFKSQQVDERKRRLRTETGAHNLILVNYESAPLYEEELAELASSLTLLVFDEVHRVKRIGGYWANTALAIAKSCERTLALTGTPIPNTYQDIYNFLHILFPREYNTFFNFQPPMLANPSDYEVEKINSKIQPFFCRTTKDDLGVPPANRDGIIEIPVDEATERVLEVLKLYYSKNMLALVVRVMQLQTNPPLLLKALNPEDFEYLLDEDEETGEIDYVDYSEEIEEMILRVPQSAKLEKCLELTKELANEGKPVIIWCVLLSSLYKIAQRLNEDGIITEVICGSTPLDERERILNSYRNGEIEVLITNPHTLAESVSLHSICHDAIYYEYSYNLVHLLQSKDRIHRLGLPNNQYTQYYFLQDIYDNFFENFSMDKAIYERLWEKEQTMLNAIAERKLETMPTTEEDLKAIFEGLFD